MSSADKENACVNLKKSRFGFKGASLKWDGAAVLGAAAGGLTPFETISKSNSMISKPRRSVSVGPRNELSDLFAKAQPSEADIRALLKTKFSKQRFDYKGRIQEYEELTIKFKALLTDVLGSREKFLAVLSEDSIQRRKLVDDFNDRIALHQKKNDRLQAANTELEEAARALRERNQAQDAELRERVEEVVPAAAPSGVQASQQRQELQALRQWKSESEGQRTQQQQQLQEQQRLSFEREKALQALEFRLHELENDAQSAAGRSEKQAQLQREATQEWERKHAALQQTQQEQRDRAEADQRRAVEALESLQREKRELQGRLDSASLEIREQTQKVSLLEQERDHLQAASAELETKRQALRGECEQLETCLREQKCQSLSECQRLQEDLHAQKMSLQKSLLEKDALCRQSESAIRGLEESQRALEECRRQREEAERSLALSCQQQQALETRVREAELSLEECQRKSAIELEHLQKQLELNCRITAQLQAEAEKAESRMKKLQGDLSSASDIVQRQKGELKEQQMRGEMERTKIKSDFDLKLREMEAQLGWENSNFEKDAEKLKSTYTKQIQMLSDERTALTGRVRELEQRLSDSESADKELSLHNTALQMSNESLLCEQIALREKLGRVESDNSTLCKQLQSLTETMNRLVESQNESHLNLQHTVEAVQEKKLLLESDKQSAEIENKRLLQALAEARADIDALRQQRSQWERTEREWKDERSSICQRVQALEAEGKRLESELAASRDRESALTSSVQSLQREVSAANVSSQRCSRTPQETRLRSEESLRSLQSDRQRASHESESAAKSLVAQLGSQKSELARLGLLLERSQRESADRERELKSEGETLQQKDEQLSRLKEAQSMLQSLETDLQKSERIRRRLHNELQDCKGCIRMVCRVRPQLSAETVEASTIEFTAPGTGLYYYESGCRGCKYSFNRVFRPGDSQEYVYQEVSPLIQSALDGYNVCLFTYGQTGSGKTYTMYGKRGPDSERGIVQRSVEEILEHVAAMQRHGWTYDLEASYLEIYNENIRDLLVLAEGAVFTDESGCLAEEQLAIKRDGTEVFVQGLSRAKVETKSQILSLIQQAENRRATSATAMNDRSSRSHTVFTLYISGRNAESRVAISGKLNLCDLAGSERLSRSMSTGSTLTEAKHINKSLSALSDVFLALGGKASHVPYRNSKLTALLQPCLSGDGKTMMILNISPLSDSTAESVCSLRFAAQVSRCELGRAKKRVRTVKS